MSNEHLIILLKFLSAFRKYPLKKRILVSIIFYPTFFYKLMKLCIMCYNFKVWEICKSFSHYNYLQVKGNKNNCTTKVLVLPPVLPNITQVLLTPAGFSKSKPTFGYLRSMDCSSLNFRDQQALWEGGTEGTSYPDWGRRPRRQIMIMLHVSSNAPNMLNMLSNLL